MGECLAAFLQTVQFFEKTWSNEGCSVTTPCHKVLVVKICKVVRCKKWNKNSCSQVKEQPAANVYFTWAHLVLIEAISVDCRPRADSNATQTVHIILFNVSVQWLFLKFIRACYYSVVSSPTLTKCMQLYKAFLGHFLKQWCLGHGWKKCRIDVSRQGRVWTGNYRRLQRTVKAQSSCEHRAIKSAPSSSRVALLSLLIKGHKTAKKVTTPRAALPLWGTCWQCKQTDRHG